MTASDESGRRVAAALSARASGAGRGSAGPARRAAASSDTGIGLALLIALLAGAALGTVLALISLLAPGVLPPLG